MSVVLSKGIVSVELDELDHGIEAQRFAQRESKFSISTIDLYQLVLSVLSQSQRVIAARRRVPNQKCPV